MKKAGDKIWCWSTDFPECYPLIILSVRGSWYTLERSNSATFKSNGLPARAFDSERVALRQAVYHCSKIGLGITNLWPFGPEETIDDATADHYQWLALEYMEMLLQCANRTAIAGREAQMVEAGGVAAAASEG